MKLKKWVKWTIGSFAVASGIVIGSYNVTAWVMGNAQSYDEKHKDDAVILESVSNEIESEYTEVESETVNEVTGINDLEGTELVDQWVDGQWWNDIDVQETIHKMSHQKVIASDKRGSIQITDKRISTMSTVIEQNKDHLENYDVYRGILDRWIKGDFSQADQDHNAIWETLDGEIGRATGVASPDQEKEYIQNTFGDGQ